MKFKKLVSIVVASAMLASMAVTTAFAEGDTDTWYASGSGTSSDPYVIETAEQFKGFRDAVNEGACGTLNSTTNAINNPKHLYVELGADIDLRNESWEPIGKGANTFRGTFDGKNHIISNLKIDTAVSSLRVAKMADYGSQFDQYDNKSIHIYGLFATADDLYTKDSAFNVKGAIKNLGIENVNVAISDSANTRVIGVLVGYPGAHTHIDKCYVKNVNVNSEPTNGETCFGTLAGSSSYSFELKSSYVSGLNFTSNQSSGKVFFGPLSSSARASTIKDCYSANVTVDKTGSAVVYATNAYYGSVTPENVYSTFTVSSPLTSGPMNGWSDAWAASQSVTPVADADLKALNDVTFTDGIFVQNNSGGYPKLHWESNEVVYELTAGTATGGSIELSSNTVAQNGTVTITVTPNANYSVVNIMANGESIWTGDSTTAVSETHTPTANTTYTATFKKELDPGLGKYIDPWQSKVYTNLDLETASGNPKAAKDCWLDPELYNVKNNDGYFTLSKGNNGKDVDNFRFYNTTWGTRLLLKSTYDFDIKVNASDLNGVSDGEIASVGTAYRWEGNLAAMESDVRVKLVFEKNGSGYQWALYRDNKGNYTAIGDKTVPAELGKYYHITYDIDATIAQARIKITPEGGATEVIESSNTGITRTYAWAFDAKIYDKVTESVYKGNKAYLSAPYLSFKKEATIDIKGFSTTNDKFICPNDIAVGCEGKKITATVDTYAVGVYKLATPPLYIAVFDSNKAFKDAAIGKITITGDEYMLYKPTAELDVSGLENGTYTVKVMLWSDGQVPFKGAVKKTLTVSNGTYTLN